MKTHGIEQKTQIDSHICSQFSMKMSRKFKGKWIIFSTNGTMLTEYSCGGKKNEPDVYFTLYRVINSKWTIDLNVRTITLKLVEENTGENLYCGGKSMHFTFSCIPYHIVKC